jgi:ATP-binding cassette subfamily B (MDR/TAP) protein 1
MTILFLSQFLGGIIIAYVRSWKMALVMTGAVPALVIILGIVGKFIATISQQTQQNYAEAGSLAEEVLSAIRTVLAFGGQKKEIANYDAKLQESLKDKKKSALVFAVGIGMLNFTIFGFIALGLWYGGTLVEAKDDPNMTGGVVLTVFNCFLIGSFSLGNIAPYFDAFASAMGAAYNVFNIIERKPANYQAENQGIVAEKTVGNIEFQNVKFSYPSRPDVPILKGLSLKINANETVAFVGSSGSGKSTIVQLLMRMYDPTEGRILLDGVDIRDLKLENLRDKIGVVSQEVRSESKV